MGKGPSTKPQTHDLRSIAEFQHVNYEIGQAPSSHIALYVPVIRDDVGQRSMANSITQMAETLH